jgi:F-type H+-transporting ATPase subunit epsilon
MASYRLQIVTPAGTAFDGKVESLTATGVAGSFGVLAGHAPMIAGIAPGVLKTRAQETEAFFTVGAGVLEVAGDVVVLADQAEPADSLEAARSRVDQLITAAAGEAD